MSACALPSAAAHTIGWLLYLLMFGAIVWMAYRAGMWGRKGTSRVEAQGELFGEAEDMEQLSMIEAMERKEAVLAEVAENNSKWMAEAVAAIEALPEATTGTGEDFRFQLLKQGLSAPGHPNAWGALFMLLTKRGVMVKTGERRPMRAPSSRGRETAIYRKVAREEVPA